MEAWFPRAEARGLLLSRKAGSPARSAQLSSCGDDSPRVLQHLRLQIARIRDAHVCDLALLVEHRLEARLDEAGIRRQTQPIDAGDDLVAEHRIEVDPVGFEQIAS